MNVARGTIEKVLPAVHCAVSSLAAAIRALLPLSTEALVSLPGKLYDECHTDENTSQKHSGETGGLKHRYREEERAIRFAAVPNSCLSIPSQDSYKAPPETGDRAAHRQQPMPDVPGRPVMTWVPGHRASDILGLQL